jgi:hypothetical protein
MLQAAALILVCSIEAFPFVVAWLGRPQQLHIATGVTDVVLRQLLLACLCTSYLPVQRTLEGFKHHAVSALDLTFLPVNQVWHRWCAAGCQRMML